LIGSCTNLPYSVVWSNLSGGSYSVAVKATDNSGLSTWSPMTSFSIVPFNDSFSNRITLVGVPVTATGSNVGATKEPGEPDHGGNPGGASIWWTWTASYSGPVTVTADLTAPWGPVPALLGIYTGASVSTLASVASNSPSIGDRAQVSLNAVQGTSYQIAVDGLYGYTGNVTLEILPILPPSVSIVYPASGVTLTPLISTNVTVIAVASDSYGSITQVSISSDGGASWIASGNASPFLMAWSNISFGTYTLVARATDNYGVSSYSTPVNMNVLPAQPPNDYFTNRLGLVVNTAVIDNNMAATSEPGEPVYSGYTAGKSVWWTWTAPSTGFFLLNVTSAQMYSPIVAVYTGSDLASLREVGTSVGYNYAGTLSFSAQAGATYDIAVDDAYGSGGVFKLLLSPQ
jgi:hypothetical protein